MGLCRTRPLTSPDVSRAISRRQARAYHRNAEVRGRLAEGREMAQSGQLAWRARGAADREPPAEFVALRSDALRRGRETRERSRAHAVQARLTELGCTDLSDYLRTAYAAGASLADLRAATGLGTYRLVALVGSSGAGKSGCGHSTVDNYRSHAAALSPVGPSTPPDATTPQNCRAT